MRRPGLGLRAAAALNRAIVGGAFIASIAVLTACTRAPSGDALFPLDAGHRFTYATTTTLDNDAETRDKLTLRTLGRDDLDGQPTWRRHSSDGADYWLRADATGIYRVASKSELDDAPKPDATPRHVLRAPYVVGTQWRSNTTAYLLKRGQEFPREIRHMHPSVPMNYQIEAIGEAVTTPAGSFTGCVRVKGLAQLRLYADPVTGWRDLPLITTEWYCPGPGLVKLTRAEPTANSPFLSGGSFTMELTEWQ